MIQDMEVINLPVEITNIDEFIKLSDKAEYCAVKKLEDFVKLKLRTKKILYTLKVNNIEKESVYKKLKCEIREI